MILTIKEQNYAFIFRRIAHEPREPSSASSYNASESLSHQQQQANEQQRPHPQSSQPQYIPQQQLAQPQHQPQYVQLQPLQSMLVSSNLAPVLPPPAFQQQPQ